ncbi:hypothetical protein G15_0103 [Enterococcus avium]|nr:hypothetical protein G15_0103 [Enterococcus avium]
MKRDVDVYSYLIEDIAERIEIKYLEWVEEGRQGEWLTDEENIKRIANGTTRSGEYGRRRNFLTTANIDELSMRFNMSPKEIVFGDNIDKLIHHIFNELAFNFEVSEFTPMAFKVKNKSKNTEDVSEIIERICLFDSNYVLYLYNLKTKVFFNVPIKNNTNKLIDNRIKYTEDVDLYNYLKEVTEYENSKILVDKKRKNNKEGKLIERADKAKNNYYKNEFNEEYQKTVNYIWQYLIYEHGDQLRNSFMILFVNGDNSLKHKFRLNNINAEISKWINNEFKEILLNMYQFFSNDAVYSIGYKVHELIQDFELLYSKKHVMLDQNQLEFLLNDFENDVLQGKELDRHRKKGYANEIDSLKVKRLVVEKKIYSALIETYTKTAEDLKNIQNKAMEEEVYSMFN